MSGLTSPVKGFLGLADEGPQIKVGLGACRKSRVLQGGGPSSLTVLARLP